MFDEKISFLKKVFSHDPYLRKNNTQIVFFCPFCKHHKRKLEISLQLECWHCWVCGKKGRSIYSLLKNLNAPRILIHEYIQLKKRLGELQKIVLPEEDDNKKLFLPSEFIPLYKNNNSIEAKRALNFLIKTRKIDYDSIIRYNIGYCESGEYKDSIIIPSYDIGGNLNYFVSRKYYPIYKIKYKNPPFSKNVVGFELFVNYDLDITLVEGAFDAINVKFNAIPLFGTEIPPILLEKFVLFSPPRINVFLDPDAEKKAIKICKKIILSGCSSRIYLVLLKDKNVDPSDLSKEDIKRAIYENCLHVTEDNLLELELKSKII